MTFIAVVIHSPIQNLLDWVYVADRNGIAAIWG